MTSWDIGNIVSNDASQNHPIDQLKNKWVLFSLQRVFSSPFDVLGLHIPEFPIERIHSESYGPNRPYKLRVTWHYVCVRLCGEQCWPFSTECAFSRPVAIKPGLIQMVAVENQSDFFRHQNQLESNRQIRLIQFMMLKTHRSVTFNRISEIFIYCSSALT